MDQVMNVRVPKDLYEKLKEVADAEDRTLHSLIRIALREYLAKVEREVE